MKTKIVLLTMMVISSLTMNAQTVMNIHQSNGTVLQIPLNTIDSITYTISNPGNLATLSTMAVGNITSNSATSGGVITNDGGTSITQRGIVWSTSPIPTTANNSTDEGSGTGVFTSNMAELMPNTTYYVRAYATNSAGTAYGNELSFTTTAGGGGIIDLDGNIYTSVIIGTQEWMVENLRTTKYANGDLIPNVTDNTQWQNLTTGAWSHYNNDSQYENPYGKLYNWYTVADPRNVCPTGWHVPSDAEWNILIGYLDPSFNPTDIGHQSVIAGGMMKSNGTQYWQSPNADATNASGFSGLPGGLRYFSGTFNDVGGYGNWWSSTENDTNFAWNRDLNYNDGRVYRYYSNEGAGFSVRCLRD